MKESFSLLEENFPRPLLLFGVSWDLSLADLHILGLDEFMLALLLFLILLCCLFSLINGFLDWTPADPAHTFFFLPEGSLSPRKFSGGVSELPWNDCRISMLLRWDKGSFPSYLMYSSASSMALRRS
jgi:hypothetical protein